MASRPSASLRSGAGVILGIPAPHEASGSQTARSNFGHLTIQDMEGALQKKAHKRPEHVRAQDGSQTARSTLEENKKLIVEQQTRKTLARKTSQDEFDKLIVQDRQNIEGEKARALNRRQAQFELAKYYKDRIGEKEKAKANEYNVKKESGAQIQYFPFVEGETINKSRQAKSAAMQEEMQDFLSKQQAQRPARPPANGGERAQDAGLDIAASPRFLNRAKAHMSRRLDDSHVRKVLEDKVMQTKLELERQAARKDCEQQQWEEGLLVNDALRYDKDQAKMADRKRNQHLLMEQVQQQKSEADQRNRAQRSEHAGYWGPEEKQPQNPEVHREHCAHLIKQMEVDQTRRLHSRGRRLRQERGIVENSIADMAQDRERDKLKNLRQKQVLTTTWESQQKLKHALILLEA